MICQKRTLIITSHIGILPSHIGILPSHIGILPSIAYQTASKYEFILKYSDLSARKIIIKTKIRVSLSTSNNGKDCKQPLA